MNDALSLSANASVRTETWSLAAVVQTTSIQENDTSCMTIANECNTYHLSMLFVVSHLTLNVKVKAC